MSPSPAECGACGGQMSNNPLKFELQCLSCDSHVPYEGLHADHVQDGEATADAGADPGAGAQAEGSEDGRGAEAAEARPAGAIELEHTTLQLLAKIIGDAYSGIEITRLLVDSGHVTIGYGGGTRWEFLYGELDLLQDRRGYRGVLEFLGHVCSSPGRGGVDIQDDINACLAYYGLGIGSWGEIVESASAQGHAEHGAEGEDRATESTSAQGHAAKGGKEPAAGGQARLDGDGEAFDQRGYHKLVIIHAREKFLKGEYFSSVTECCKAFEELVQKKSGIDDRGADLMGKALGPEGALALTLAGLKGETKENMRRGLLHLCQGIVANVRNPVSHELERRFRMRREDALDILGTISYLCRQVGKTRRKSGREPTKKEKRAAGENAAGSRKEGRAQRGAIAHLSVSPESVVQRDTVRVTVKGRGIGGWYVSVLSEEGEIKSRPTRLGAYGVAAGKDNGAATYAFPVSTLNYEPGEYRISVSSNKDMDAEGMRIKKFTVHTYEDMMDAIGGTHP